MLRLVEYPTWRKVVKTQTPLPCGCLKEDTEGWICKEFQNCDSDDWKCDTCYHYKKCHGGVHS